MEVGSIVEEVGCGTLLVLGSLQNLASRTFAVSLIQPNCHGCRFVRLILGPLGI
jgi:hypothetical protein